MTVVFVVFVGFFGFFGAMVDAVVGFTVVGIGFAVATVGAAVVAVGLAGTVGATVTAGFGVDPAVCGVGIVGFEIAAEPLFCGRTGAVGAVGGLGAVGATIGD